MKDEPKYHYERIEQPRGKNAPPYRVHYLNPPTLKELMEQPTAELRLQWEREAEEWATLAEVKSAEIPESDYFQFGSGVIGYLAARLVAYQEYCKELQEMGNSYFRQLEEKDREIAELKKEVKDAFGILRQSKRSE